MVKEDRLTDTLTKKDVECCSRCKYFEKDINDTQGVGGTCCKFNDFSFTYQYCKDFTLKPPIYKCPICGKEIHKHFNNFTTITACDNFCFEKIEDNYVDCPVCKIGKLNQICMHGNREYVKCSMCLFEMPSFKLISLLKTENDNFFKNYK